MPPSLQEQHSLLGHDDNNNHPQSHHAQHTHNNKNDLVVVLTMDDAMDRLGFGPFQHRLVWAAGLCVMADGLEILLLSVLTVVLRSQWSLTSLQSSMLMSSVFCGALPGSLILGQAADRYGRQPVFLLAAALIAIMGVATAAAPHFGWLLACRWGVGFGVGGGTVPFDTLCEFLPRQQRGHSLLLIWFFWTLGTLLVVLLAYATIGQGQHDDDDEGWRLFVLACALPCTVSLVLGILWVPESPRWLITAHNDSQQALHILRQAAVINGKDPDLIFPMGTTLVTHDPLPIQDIDMDTTEACKQQQHHQQQQHGPFRELFQPKWLRTTLFLFGTWLGFDFLYYGGVIVTTLVFAGGTASDNSYHFDYGALLVTNAAELVATFLIVWQVDRVGRIPIQIGCYLGGGILVWILCLVAQQQQQQRQEENHPDQRTLVFAMIVVAFGVRLLNMAASCTTWVSTAEIYTTDVRSTGHATASAVARLGGMLVPYLVSATTPLPVVGWAMMVVAVGTAYCASQLPETKGKDLGIMIIS